MPFSSTVSSVQLFSTYLGRTIQIFRPFVSDCLFGRFHHCSVESVNGQGRFILEDAEAVPERDAELLLDECVLQL